MYTVVVGVDGSESSAAALTWALTEARAHDARVIAVHAWSLPYHQGEIAHLAYQTLGPQLDTDAHHLLDQALRAAGIADDDPCVERRIVRATPLTALTDAAADGDLLVVGSHGRGGFAGMLLGSVSHQCAQHAPCPVVIIRND